MARNTLRRIALAAAALAWFSAARAEIVINEILYNSPGSTDVEFVELYNAGAAPQELAGWYLLDDDDGHEPCPLDGSLQPGAYLVVPGRADLFAATYPEVTAVNPTGCDSAIPGAGFAWGNSEETVRLFAPGGVLADAVAYTDTAPWPEAADGDGPTLELINPLADNAAPESWAAGVPGGTPGEQNSTFVADLPPTVTGLARDLPLPGAGDTVRVTARAQDESALASVELWVDTGSGFAPVPMFDDGTQDDGAAGDSVYGAAIPPEPGGTVVRYYVEATDDGAQTATSPPEAPATFHAYTVGYRPPELRVNELVASNQNGIADEFGDQDDWLELFNLGPDTINTGGMFLSRDPADPTMWELPPVVMPPGGRLVIWCDAEPGQGLLHAGFRLPAAGGSIGLYDTIEHGNGLIHGWAYGPQNPDRPVGFLPEDSDRPELLALTTPGGPNETVTVLSPVCINEFLASSALGVPDWIELYNRGTASFDVGGWGLSDDPLVPMKFVIPAGTVLAPGEHVVFDEVDTGFGISADGDEPLLLTQANGVTAADWVGPGPQLSDVSYGRFPDGSPDWHFFSASSLELPNSCDQGQLPLDPVTGLRFETPDALSWTPLAGATRYDLLRGDLRPPGGDLADGAFCLQNNGLDTRGWALGQPVIGEGWFFLVRGVTDTCRYGSWESGGGSQAAPRGGPLAGVCP